MQNNENTTKFYAGIVTPNGNYVIGPCGGAVSCALAARPNFPGRQFDSRAQAQAALPAWLKRQDARKRGPQKCGNDAEHYTFVCPTTDIVYPR